MFTPKTLNASEAMDFTPYGTREFNLRVDEGLRRAPQERAKAIKEFWSYLTSRRR